MQKAPVSKSNLNIMHVSCYLHESRDQGYPGVRRLHNAAVQAHNLGLGNARRVHDAYVHTRHAGEHGVRDAYDTQQRGRARGPG